MSVSGWSYKKTITLSPVTPQANYQIKIELTPDNFDYSHAKLNGDDLRFYQADDSPLDYWIETWDPSGTSIIWVEVAISGTNTIYMYYGNSFAESASNGDNTFEFFDDFEDLTGYFLTNWTKDPNNPILDISQLNQGFWPAAAYDPDQGSESPWFVLIQKDAHPSNDIELFTGPSANSLTEHSSSPINLPSGSWDSGHREPHSLVWDEANSNWRLYYCGKPTGADSNEYRIGVATSTDFINWTPDANNPVVGPYNSEGVADPVVVRWNNKWYLSAGTYPSQTARWWISDDGITGWTYLGTNPGGPGFYPTARGYGIFAEVAIPQGIMGITPSRGNLGDAEDGEFAHFTNNPGVINDVGYSNNPVISPVLDTWEHVIGALHSDIVSTKDHTDKIGGLYYFYYFAEDSSGKYQMGLATCSGITEELVPLLDGVKWSITNSDGSFSIVNSIITLSGNTGLSTYSITSKDGFSPSIALRTKSKLETTVAADQITRVGWSSNMGPGAVKDGNDLQSAQGTPYAGCGDGTNYELTNIGVTHFGDWYIYDITRLGTKTEFYKNGVLINSCNHDLNADRYVSSSVRDSEYKVYSDWFFVRKSDPSEPAVILGYEIPIAFPVVSRFWSSLDPVISALRDIILPF